MALVHYPKRTRNNSGGYGSLANVAQGALQLYTGGSYRNYKRAAKLGMRAAQAGARGIQGMYRSWKARKGVRDSAAARSGRATAPGVSNSATHGGTRRLSSRRQWKRKGRTSRRKGRGGRRRKGRGGGVMKYLIKMFTTPQITKVTRALAYIGVGPGCRTWATWLVNSRDNMVDMWAHRPNVFLSYAGSDPASAATQTGYSNSHKCHITSFTNVFTLQNRSNWDMELKVYECVVRRDHSFTLANTTDLIGDWVLARFTESDKNTESKGMLQPAYAGAGDALGQVERNPAYTPYMSSYFCNVFRVIKTTAFKIGMSDYVKYSCRVNPKKFDGADISLDTSAGFQENIGGWTKILLFSWVGGPIDDNTTTNLSKSQADLFVQCDVTYKYYFEPRGEQLYNIASSNATVSQLGHETANSYKTVTAPIYFAPASSIQEPATTGEMAPATHP